VLRRLIGFAVTLLLAAAVIFLLLDLLPGDPARFILGINASAEAVAALRTQLGLDAPAHERFLGWVWGMLHGDFGVSVTQRAPVAALIAERLAVTLPLTLIAMAISMAVGLPIGILAARRRGKATDTALMVLAQTGVAIPNFWFGMLLTLLFAVTLRWLPPGGFTPWQEDGWAALRGLILPGLALALPQASILARVMRTALVDVTGQDFIRTAHAKGLPERAVTVKHALRNILIPVVTVIGLDLASFIDGAFLTEYVFNIPGMGRYGLGALLDRDLPVMIPLVIYTATLYIFANLVVDLLYGVIDPRIRYD